jgi:hypothetical protein
MISSIFKRLTNNKTIRLHNIKLLTNQDDVNEKENKITISDSEREQIQATS